MARWSRWRLALTGAAVLAVSTTCERTTEPASTEPPRLTAGTQDVYDIRNPGSYSINGATWNTASDFGVGTGLLEPFMRVQDNDGNEEGFNTDCLSGPSCPPLDLGNTANFNHSLALNRVPVITFGAVSFRELILDANEANSDPDANFSVDRFNLWLCKQVAGFDPTQVDARADFEGSADCAPAYSLDDGANDGDWAKATDASSKGSGKSYDYQILIPETNFVTAAATVGIDLSACSYGGPTATPCGAWLILDVRFGFQGGDFAVSSTFEEVATLARPWVTVTKTATPSYTKRYSWVIEKSVDPTSIALFEGQSQDATWTVEVTPGEPASTNSDGNVSGTITIANTSGNSVQVLSVDDAIPGYPAIDPTCPGEPFPAGGVTLTNNQMLVCTYSVTAPSIDPGTVHTNAATVAIEAALENETHPPDAATFSGSKDFDFASATPTEIDKNPDVYDNYNAAGEELIGQASGSPFTFTRTYTCDGDEGEYSNVARVDITNPPDDPTATASLTVDCLDITVTKTSDESRTDTFHWLIDKSVTPASWELFKNDQGTSDYTITVTPDGVTQDAHNVSGVITVTGDPNAPVYIQHQVTDAIEPGGLTPTVTDCQDNGSDVVTPLIVPYTLEAGHVLTCDYSQALPNSDSRTNTASVVARPTPSGADKTFTGSAPVDFSGAVLTEVDKSPILDDSYSGGPQDVVITNLLSPTTFTYSRTFGCDGDAGTHENTATLSTTPPLSDDASVSVLCRSVTVTKDARTSFDRDFDWLNDKSADQSGPLQVMPGQPFVINYSVAVTKTGPFDSHWHVTGTITVTHDHTTEGALLNSLADLVSDAGSASLSGCEADGNPFSFPGTLAVDATLTCTYDLDLSNSDSRTNTATATQQNHSFSSGGAPTASGTTQWASSAVSVTFGDPTSVTDDCADVEDGFAGSLGHICASQTFTYARTVTAPEGSCEDFTVDNTATVTPDDDPPVSDGWSIPFDVQCPQGCTLTLGYWKTHNLSFRGGALPDDNWGTITPNAEQTGFFTTDAGNSFATTGPNIPPFTWFGVFWTAVKGNAYYNLAQQYMAAKLNILNGADPTAVSTAITLAEGLFGDPAPAYTPAQIDALKGSDPLRQLFISLAGTLGSYNEGSIGPGHCSEDATSELTR